MSTIGLDPLQGSFHTPRHGHAALASDLIEEFRSPIADSLVLTLLRRKQLKPEEIVKEKGEFRLTTEASKVFFTEFEHKLSSRRTGPENAELNLSYAQIMVRQVHHFAGVIKGEDTHYVPFVLK